MAGRGAPVQLLAQHCEITVALGMQQANAVGRTGDPHGVARTGVVAGLAVEVNAGVVGRQQDDVDPAGIRQRDRPRSECMGTHRHQRNTLDTGMQNRAIGRQRVGCRAGGRGDDHAVGTLGVNELAVDAQVEFDHAPQITLIDDDIVESHCMKDPLAVAQHFRIKQDSGLLGVAAVQDFTDFLKGHLTGDVRQKPEPALIDARQRHLVFGKPAGAVEQRAVTAEHHGQIRVAADLLVGGNRKSGTQSSGTCRTLFDQHIQPQAAQIVGEAEHGLGHFGALVFAYQCDGLEFADHGSIKPHSSAPSANRTARHALVLLMIASLP